MNDEKNSYMKAKDLMMTTVWPDMPDAERRMLTRIIEEMKLRDREEADYLHGLDREAQTYILTRKPDNTYTFHLPEAKATDIIVHGELAKDRYHDRFFQKGYRKKKKAKRRQQNRARRKH